MWTVDIAGSVYPVTFGHISTELNGHEEAFFTTENTDRLRKLVAQDRDVTIKFLGRQVFFGTLAAPEYTERNIICKVYNKVYNLMNKKEHTQTYADPGTAADTILGNICDEVTGVSAGSCPSDAVAVRYSRTSCLDAAKYLAQTVVADFWSSGGDTFNIGTRGSQKGKIVVLSVSRRKINRAKKRDKVYVRGQDEDGNAIEGTYGAGTDVVSFTERKATNVATLNNIAEYKYNQLNKDSSGIKLTSLIQYAYDLDPGDTVVIDKSELNLSGSYKIWRIIKRATVAEIEIDKQEELLQRYLERQRELEDVGIYPPPTGVNSGATFPDSPEDGEIFNHTGWGIEFRWDETNNWWVAIDYDGTKGTLVTVDAAGTSITIQNNTTGLTITSNTTDITITSNATGITINTGSTSISINKHTSDITIVDQATGLTIQISSTGITIQDHDADTSVISDNSNVTAQSTYLDWDYVGIYTGTLDIGFGNTSSVDVCTLPNNVEIIAECGIGLQTGSPDVIEACHFLFAFWRLGSERYAIGAPVKEWTEKASGFYPWRGLLNDFTGSSSNKIRLTVENKKTSGTLYIQYRVRVQSRAAHSHTMNDPNHPHGTTDPGHPHTPTDPSHPHTPTDPDHDHSTTEPEGGLGHPHTPTDPGHPHGKTDPGHPHGKSDPGHPHGKSDPGHPHAPTDPEHPHDITDPDHEHKTTKTEDPP